MTIELKLVHSGTTLSLKQSANSGWRLASEGWFPKAAPIGSDEPVVETINLVCDAASHDTLATDTQELDYMRKWAHRYMVDPTSEHPVWLHAKMQNETGERRALVTNIEVDWLDPLLETDTGGQAENEVKAQLKISRMPWWESTSMKSTEESAELAGAAIQFDYTDSAHADHTPTGDQGARVYYFDVESDTSGALVQRLWAGLRSKAKHGTLASFEPIWELEAGTNVGADVSDDTTTDQNGASPGSGSGEFVKVVPSAQDWDTIANGGAADDLIKVLGITLANVAGANALENFGDFLWLLRYKLSAAASTWEVQLHWGYSGMDDGDYVQGPVRELDCTSWNYEAMGRMSVPMRSVQALPTALIGDGFDVTYEVQIWARRTSGAANLYLDCFCPIPLDEGWLKLWGFSLPGATTTDAVIWATGAGISEHAMARNSNSLFTFAAACASSGFQLPRGEANLVLVYSGELAHDLTKGITIRSMGYFDQYAGLKGDA